MSNHQPPLTQTHYQLTPTLSLQLLLPEAAPPLAAQLIMMEPWQSLGFTLPQLINYLTRADPCLHRFQCCYQQQSVGVIAVREPWLRGVFLELFAVFTSQQRQGIGEHIMCWLIQETTLYSNNLWTTVSDFNTSAQHFYARHEFTPIGRIPDLIQVGHEEILLRRHLK